MTVVERNGLALVSYDLSLQCVQAYVAELRVHVAAGRIPESVVEPMVRAYVEQPQYEVTYRASLISEALAE